MSHHGIAAKLSRSQCDALVEMVDGVRPYVEDGIGTGARLSRAKLFAVGLMRHCGEHGGTTSTGRQFYCLTEDGRGVLCALLGQYADALCRAEEAAFAPVKPILTRLGYGRMVIGDHHHAPDKELADA